MRMVASPMKAYLFISRLSPDPVRSHRSGGLTDSHQLGRLGVAEPDGGMHPAEEAWGVPAVLPEHCHECGYQHPAYERRVDQDRQPGAEPEELDEAHPARGEGEEAHRQ